MGGDIFEDNENTNVVRFSKFPLERRGQKKASASLEGMLLS